MKLVRFTIIVLLLLSFSAIAQDIPPAGDAAKPTSSAQLNVVHRPGTPEVEPATAVSTDVPLPTIMRPIFATGGTSRATSKRIVVNGTPVAAGDVVAGTFGASQGNGDYTFPGKVGIGTTPASPLHLWQNNLDGTGIQLYNAAAAGGYPYSVILQAGSSAYGIPGWANAGILEGTANGGLVLDGYAGNILFQTARNTRMTILNSNGNLGIGTTAPVAKVTLVDGTLPVGAGEATHPGTLQISTNLGNTFDNGGLEFKSAASGAGYGFRLTAPDIGTGEIPFHIQSRQQSASWTDRVTVLASNGNVGIGTTTPGARLDIGAGVTPRGGATDLLIGSGGDLPSLEFYGTSNSGAINYDGTSINFWTNGSSWLEALSIGNNGHLGVGKAPDSVYALDVNGSIRASSVIGAVYQDVAEWVPATETMLPGTVVVLNTDRNNEVMPSARAYDTAVAGVVSARPGVLLGVASASKAQIATTGRVRVKVDATKQPIKVGDLLVTSDRSGLAMKSIPLDLGGVAIHRPGTLIGKALEPLPSGEGEILVLLSLQ